MLTPAYLTLPESLTDVGGVIVTDDDAGQAECADGRILEIARSVCNAKLTKDIDFVVLLTVEVIAPRVSVLKMSVASAEKVAADDALLLRVVVPTDGHASQTKIKPIP